MVHKFAAPRGRRQEILQTSVALLAVEQGVPLVATSEAGRVGLLWWDAHHSDWQYWERLTAIGQRERIEIGRIRDDSWSPAIALATSGPRAYLLYKRKA